jgi:hypothetical protein
MSDYRPSDEELARAFLAQPDRYAHSGLKLTDCFSWLAFDLVFTHGTAMQRSAVRQGLIACLSLPSLDAPFTTPLRHMTMEKHLHNWLLHGVRIISYDSKVEASDRRIARHLVETGMVQAETTFAREQPRPYPIPDKGSTQRINETSDLTLHTQQPVLLHELHGQIERALKQAFGITPETVD